MVDYLPKGETITGKYYANLLRQLRDKIKPQRPGMLTKGVLFHHDDAPVHTSLAAVATIRECGYELLPHPLYSPDLAPSDFHLFPNLKNYLSGEKYETNDDVISAVDAYFGGLDEPFFSTGITALQHRWKKCVNLQRDYVEK